MDNADSDMGAAIAAIAFNMGDAMFKDIRPGECFRFKASPPDECFVKLASGGYRLANDRTAARFKTGQRTAVYRMAEHPACG